MQSNTWKLYIIQAVRNFMVIMPIVVPFLQSNGLNLTQIFILQAIFGIILLTLEVPSGYISDRWGRRNCIITSLVLASLGFTFYATGTTFSHFFVGEIILAVSAALMSGSDTALLYDSLEKSDTYMQQQGRLEAIGNISEAIAAIVGGILASISLRLPAITHTLLITATIPFAIALREPTTHEYEIKDHWHAFKRILHEEFTSEARYLALYGGLLGGATLTAVWFVQPFLQETNVPIAYYGVIWSGLNLFAAGAGVTAHRYEAFIGKRWTLYGCIPLITVGFVLPASFTITAGILFFLIPQFVHGLNTPVIKSYLNDITASHSRATVLSVKNMVTRLSFSLIGPPLALLHDTYSLTTALIAAAGIFTSATFISAVFVKI